MLKSDNIKLDDELFLKDSKTINEYFQGNRNKDVKMNEKIKVPKYKIIKEKKQLTSIEYKKWSPLIDVSKRIHCDHCNKIFLTKKTYVEHIKIKPKL